MNLIRLALASLKKKNSLLSVSLLMMFAVMLLESGIFLLFVLPGNYDETNRRLNAPDYVARLTDNQYQTAYLDYFKADKRSKAAEAVPIVIMDQANYKTKKGKMILYASFMNTQDTGEMYTFNPLYEDTEIPKEKAIYVPFAFYQQGYQTGDEVSFLFQSSEYLYTIAGFFETTWFGSSSSPLYNYYLQPEAFEKLYHEIGGGKLLSVQFVDGQSPDEVSEDFKKATGLEFDAYSLNALSVEFTADQMKSSNMILVTIVSALAILFAVLLLTIVLLVLWFRIINQIQDSLKSIGVMQALGFKTSEIRMTIIWEHLLAILPGGIAGVLCSYGFLALLGKLISGSMGILYQSSFRPLLDGIALSSVLFLLFLAAYAASGRVKKITPVEAFRNGKKAHHFSASPFPLSQGKGGLFSIHVRLSLKSVWYTKRPYITLSLVLVGVSMILTFALILYENLGINEAGFIEMMGSEACDVMIEVSPHADLDQLQEEIENLDEVMSTSFFETSTMEAEGIVLSANVSKDFDKLKTYKCYDGSFPIYDNEIAISGVVADKLGKKIGDWVKITKNDVTAEYLICGLVQSMSNFGLQAAVSLEGARRIDPTFQFSSIYIYLNEGSDYESFTKLLEKQYPMSKLDKKLSEVMEMYQVDSLQYALVADGKTIWSGDSSSYLVEGTQDMKTMVMTGCASYMVMIQVLSVFLLLLSAAVTFLILHLFVKASIDKRKQEFGILKAMGYSSRGLMLQVAVAYLPVSIPGVFAGCLLGGILTGPVISRLTYTLGVSKIPFKVSILSVSGLAFCIFVYLFLSAWVAARKVKKISVYELFTE